ncbi:hypothetical protein NS220_09315 [Microbacterium testaceum]|uniref:Uncharacterized protein n=1 Tax=Microbacterium testaceum TaxID=2033 RepID=A0A147EXB5_MICTE|nr:DUF6507 family protein [Microbacterium testaceum]KTR94335.1 hypothetical protein NS220_09315 [Microbacterium testaceum]
MTWSIDPAQARAVCRTADEHAQAIDDVVTATANAFDTAQTAVGEGETSAALAEVAADPFLIRLAGMRRHVSTVTETTESVIALYDHADYDMAAQTQSTLNGWEP